VNHATLFREAQERLQFRAELMAMNEVFREYFPKEPPARTTVQAAGLVAGAQWRSRRSHLLESVSDEAYRTERLFDRIEVGAMKKT